MKKVCVLGLGYIGLPTAAMFAIHGLRVIGVDINPQIITALGQGNIHIHEPGLPGLVQEALALGNLEAHQTPEPADAFIIAVPTPFKPDKTADMQAVIAATQAILPVLKPGNLVVLESTSPPRTTVDLVQPILENSGLKAGRDFQLAYSPERVLPGQILKEIVENARVIGGIDRFSAEAGRALYRVFVTGEIILTDATTAEMVKLMENTYRDVNIAIANEFSRLADRFGINIWEAIAIANHHPRVRILNPGIGVGGHCISVDPWFLVESAPDITPLIRTSRQVNDSQPRYVLALLQRALVNLTGKHIAALGLTYKPDVDDLRESPAIELIQLLVAAGAQVRTYEPYKPLASIPGAVTCPDLASALAGADVLLFLVDHGQFRNLDLNWIAAQMPGRQVVDARPDCNPAAWRSAGFEYLVLGDGSNKTDKQL
jgi:UDP-N-acetyl-D-mannosaminuronic acid dehydrogenase